MTHSAESEHDPDQLITEVVPPRHGPNPLPDCARCGHSSDAHRLDDSLNLDPTDPAAPFRCVGYQVGGRWIDTACDCPDYVIPR